MKKITRPLATLVALFLSLLRVLADEGRAVCNINPGWRLLASDASGSETPNFDDSKWRAISLPHAWNEDDAFRKPINELPTGIAWYRKHFVAPPNTAGRKVFLEFEGVRQAADVWLNGHYLGLHENGINAFGFDVTNFLKPAPQENVLSVRTDSAWDYREKASNSRYQWNDRNFNANYGGINKNVKLHVTDPLYQTLPLYGSLGTTGVYIYGTDYDIAGRAVTVNVESQVRNETKQAATFSLQVEVTDTDGKIVKTFQGKPQTVAPGATVIANASDRLSGVNFWSWGYGYLYNVKTSLLVDGKARDPVNTRTGFRKTSFANGMLTLNDRAIHLKGYAQRSTNEWPAVGNAVPAWLSDYSNRLMVESGANLVRWMHVTPARQDIESCDRVGLMQALPAGDSESDVQGRRWEQRVEAMRDSIIYNRNSPSVVFYESGNKGISEEHMQQMKDLRDQFDPHGGRAAGCREMMGSKVAEYGGEMLYINKSAHIPLWAMEYSRDEGLRKYWDEFSPPFHKEGDGPKRKEQPGPYNHNQDEFAIEDVRRWFDYWHERPGTGRRVNAGGVNIIFSDSNTHFRGAENYRRSGEVDAMRIPKDGFWAHQVMWNGWVDVEKPGIHILGHWNYAPGVKKSVYVVSTAPVVELFLNGRSLGKGTKSLEFLHTFTDVAWQPGDLRAVGSDGHGKKLCEFALATAGEPAALRLKPITDPRGWQADGADLALVEIEVVDAKGNRCPTALDPVSFKLSGPAEWRGGIAQGPDNCILATTLPVECGVNRVLLRAGAKPGKIELTAASGKLKPANLSLATVPAPENGGLTTRLVDDALASNLDRGPTPAGPSFHMSRLDVPVASVTATDNNENAAASCDDNEATSWAGSGLITFELARPAKLTEITAKFGGFRSKSYPLRITVDGQEVFRGSTPRNLGYATLALKPVAGRKVTIELVGEGKSKDAFGGVKELENQLNAETQGANVGSHSLSIVEIEFYEAVK